MTIVDRYLTYLHERAWDYDQNWENQIDIKLIRDLIGKKDIDQEKLNKIRHIIQPMLIQLFINAGGDYRGRETTKNTTSGDFSGMDWLEKQLPKGWEEKAKKYIEKVARKHQ